ncbi:MAG: DUF2079 domain-containing protein [Beutenbergiaceae bacterium]
MKVATHPAVVGGIVSAALTALYCWFSIRQWQRFEVPSWDLGIFTQVVRSYSEWRAPVATIKGEDFMILGDHFHPLLVLLAPLYALFPSGLTLLIAQAILVGISVLVLTACAVRHLGIPAGVGIGIGYGLAWGLQSAVAAQFHEVALALPLLAAVMAALIRRADRAAALWALPLLGVKEDLGLTVAMIGVVIALRGSRRIGIALAGTGVAAFILTTQVVLPALNPDGVWDYAADSIVSLALTDPGAAVGRLVDGGWQKLTLLALIFGIAGFIALRSPLALITLPTLAWRLTSDVEYHWGTYWHYSAVLMPIVFAAAIDALIRSAGWKRLAPGFAAAMAAIALVLSTQFPLWQLTDPQFWRTGQRSVDAEAAMAMIDDDALVVTDITLMAYLAPRTEVYWLGNEGNPVPDYVVLDQNSGIYTTPPTDAAAWAEVHFGDDYTQVFARGGFLLAVRTDGVAG